MKKSRERRKAERLAQKFNQKVTSSDIESYIGAGVLDCTVNSKLTFFTKNVGIVSYENDTVVIGFDATLPEYANIGKASEQSMLSEIELSLPTLFFKELVKYDTVRTGAYELPKTAVFVLEYIFYVGKTVEYTEKEKFDKRSNVVVKTVVPNKQMIHLSPDKFMLYTKKVKWIKARRLYGEFMGIVRLKNTTIFATIPLYVLKSVKDDKEEEWQKEIQTRI